MKKSIDFYIESLLEDLRLEKINTHSLIKRLHQQKLFPNAIPLSGHLKDDPRWTKELETHIYQQNIVKKSLKALGKIYSDFEEFVILKGSAITQFYPEGLSRSSWDIDIITPSFESFFDFAKRLEENGFVLVSPIYSFHEKTLGGPLGNARFALKEYPEYGVLEVHFGGFLYTEKEYLPSSAVFEDKRNILIGSGVTIPTPSIFSSILILLAEVLSRNYSYYRDLVDLSLLLENYKGNMEILLEAIEAYDLGPSISSLVNFKHSHLKKELRATNDFFKNFKCSKPLSQFKYKLRYPIFKLLSKSNKYNSIDWIYQFLLLFRDFFEYQTKSLVFLSQIFEYYPGPQKFWDNGAVTILWRKNNKYYPLNWIKESGRTKLESPIGKFILSTLAKSPPTLS